MKVLLASFGIFQQVGIIMDNLYFRGTRGTIFTSHLHLLLLPDRKRVELFDLADSKWSDRRWCEDAALPWTLLAQAANQTTNCSEAGHTRPSDTL